MTSLVKANFNLNHSNHFGDAKHALNLHCAQL